MFNNLTKLTKIVVLTKKDQCNSLFHFSEGMGSITFFLKKVPWQKFVKKDEYSAKYFVICEMF